jgi:hypothetical protein
MLSDLLRWGPKRPAASTDAPSESPPSRGEEALVPSKALPKFLNAISHQPGAPVLVDFGPVIGSNVEFFGERLGCKLFIEDLFADYDRHSRAGTRGDLPTVLASRFRHADASVDGVLCWDVFDFLDKAAAHELARQIARMLKPGGAVMAFFCTSSVERSAFMKFEVTDETSLRHRHHTGLGGPKQALLNRDIIKMFDGLVVSDSFLLKNNTREMLLRKKA